MRRITSLLTSIPLKPALVLAVLLAIVGGRAATGAEPKKLLFIGEGPDGHPPTTHEFMAGGRVLEAIFKDSKDVELKTVKSVEPWPEGPELIAGADGIVIFVCEGARWAQAEPRRFEALNRLAARGGGIVALHWGIGAKDPKYIDGYRRLIGGIHGGPDRKYKVLTTSVTPAKDHPIARGLAPFQSHDEFYYSLKFFEGGKDIQPVLEAEIEDKQYPVAWAWPRPDGGRSFGFSGLHFHENWKKDNYRKLVTNGILWTLKLEVPEQGAKVDVDEAVYKLPAGTK